MAEQMSLGLDDENEQTKKTAKKKTAKKKQKKRPIINYETGEASHPCILCENLILTKEQMEDGKALNVQLGRVWNKRGKGAFKIDQPVDILFLAESPGERERLESDILVGRSGIELKQCIYLADADIHYIYLDNAVRCSLISDMGKMTTVQQKKLVKMCKPFLAQELKRLKPKVIVTLGNVPLKALCELSGVSNWRGKVLIHRETKAYVIPTYHPAAILRNKLEYHDTFISDIKLATTFVKKRIRLSHPEKIFVDSNDKFKQCINEMKQLDVIVADLETVGFDAWQGIKNIIGLAVCCHKDRGYFIPFMQYRINDQKEWEWIHELGIKDLWLKQLKKEFEKKKKLKIFHNAGFDLLWLKQLGWDVYPIYDTIITSSVLDNKDNDLKSLAWSYTDFGGYEAELKGMLKSSKTPYTEIPPDVLSRYAALDGIATYKLYKKQILEDIAKHKNKDNLMALINELNELRYNLTEMEFEGCMIDLKKVESLRREYIKRLEEYAQEMRELLKIPDLNLNSSKQLIDIFFGENGMFTIQELRLKKASSDVATLKLMKAKCSKKKTKKAKNNLRVVELLLNYRKDGKRLSSYLNAYKENHINGKIHPWFKVYSTKTGRLSSNLQQVPRGDEIRGCFIARDGYKLVDFDYSQLEIKVAAEYCQDEELCSLVNSGEDIHALIGHSSIKQSNGEDYDISEFITNEELRAMAKGINFSVLYGKTLTGLAEHLGLSIEEAAKIQSLLFSRFPELYTWIREQHRFALGNKYVETLFGRILRFTGFNFHDNSDRAAVCRRAVNWPIQSAASDCVVLGLNRLKQAIKGMPVNMLLTVHDSILCEVKDDVIYEYLGIAKSKLEQSISNINYVDLTVDCKVGQSWGKMKEIKL